ncbi:MAG: elongation factor 4 [Planctomycetes bacterium]|nr:elongation factor 4 [Planctomycetota bacterium]
MAKKQAIPPDRFRNFSIVAHIDHGKSTLADRIMQLTGCVEERDLSEQMLDSMDIERERGITIKSRAVRATYKYDDELYRINLIDTPGHVDFTYEVSRSLNACDGAILLVDATQGVEAQTLSNAYMAIDAGLEIIPVLNKVDLPHSDPEAATKEIEESFGFTASEIITVSAKTGEGVNDLMDAIIERFPAPSLESTDKLKGLLFDAEYNDYRGVISYVKIVSGVMKRKQDLQMLGSDMRFEVTEVGAFTPEMTPVDELGPGDVGYMISNIKELDSIRIGDTAAYYGVDTEPLPGYQEPQKMVYCSLYPANNVEFESLKKGLERLHLNDSSFSFQMECSSALSFGFRCGFMGMLHMDVIRERIERESDLAIIQTAPHVTYELLMHSGEVITIETPSDLPDLGEVEEIREPIVLCNIITPSEYIGAVMTLAEERRGSYIKTQYMTQKRVIIEYKMPFNEVVFDFFDRLKSSTKGYATLDYQLTGYEKSDLVKMDILVNGESVDALSCMMHRTQAAYRGRAIIKKLKTKIPRHQFQIPIQASIGARIVARENISALRKDVTAKCYGGDISRKRKLLEKQKEGKKKMKNIGNVSVPQEAFLSVLDLQAE